ncbi:YceI family protein [Pseudoxanthomonas suwonensis]|uniref:YceI family protein n=1 Tax=Pseudoxanthomonas suwonensis TaxID=314722 RepID=UPI0009E1A1C0
MTCPRPQTAPPRPLRRFAVVLALLATLACAGASAATVRYELDPVHTRVQFAVSHAGFSQALGTVSGSTGTLEFDPADWSSARLDVSVPLQRLDLGDAEWNRATLARNLLDAQRWPEARFVSTRVEPLAPDRFIVHGQLTLRGVTHEVPLEVTFNALKRHPLPPFRRTAGFSATATLSRAAFGIDAWPSTIGDRVELRIEVEATRAGRGDGTQDDSRAPTAVDPDPADPTDSTDPADSRDDDAIDDAVPASEPVRQEPTPA